MIAQSWIVLLSAEDIGAGTLHPIRTDRGINGFLHVCAVEINFLSRWDIVAMVDLAENRPSRWA